MATFLQLNGRIRAARKASGFKTAKAFLKKHKIPASTYSQHESGARTPDEDGLKFYAKVFNVELSWLIKGKGDAFKKMTLFKKKTLEEESFHLRRSEHIYEELLAKMLARVIKAHAIKLSAKSVRVIAEESAEAYNKAARVSK